MRLPPISRRIGTSQHLVALCSVLTLAACAGRQLPGNDGSAGGTREVRAGESAADQQALLLLLEDRKQFDAVALRPLLAGPPALREALATSLGRIGRSEGIRMLESLALDPEASVRRAAVFALGELGGAEVRPALLRAAADEDGETGALAVEALGKSAARLDAVESALTVLPQEERDGRLLAHLYRFTAPEDDARRLAVARAGLRLEPSGGLRAAAAYGLARDPRPSYAPVLRELLRDEDAWIRGWAARGVGGLGEMADLARLRPLLEDAEAGPVIQALRAGARLVGQGTSAPPDSWRVPLLELLEDSRPGVAISAAEAAGAWLLDAELGAALASKARGSGRLAEVALLALAAGRDPRAGDLVSQWAVSPDRVRRLRAAEAASTLQLTSVLPLLSDDPWPAVRGAVLAAILRDGGDHATQVAALGLQDPDPVVRAGVLEDRARNPTLELAVLATAWERGLRDSVPDARLAAVRALGARAAAERLEAGAGIEWLERVAAEDPEFLVRREAATRLVDLGREAPDVGSAAPVRPLAFYREVVVRTARPREVDLRTRLGVVRLELACPQAPRTCTSFLQLAAQGFFDGLAFHRVVPDFVVQGGCPRGDGAGGPGYSLRDEINRLRYVRGAVGMALSGPDTGGSQFFVATSPQPHLDGGYTVFGRVIEGMDVLDRLEQGDSIERVVVRSAEGRRTEP